MNLIDLGSGPPIVLVPGIQGRWEWMRPTVEALARSHRVISYSLCGDPGSGCDVDPKLGFDSFVAQLDSVWEHARLERAALCGVSFGGLIAVRYAARRQHRVSALILVSALSTRWQPSSVQTRYMRAPWLFAPAFALGSVQRLRPELVATFPKLRARVAFTVRHLARILGAPASPPRMRERIQLGQEADLSEDCGQIDAPTLAITGEAGLDRVVPAEVTREYLGTIAGCRHTVLERTGHIGLVTRPEEFARLVGDFIDHATASRKDVAAASDPWTLRGSTAAALTRSG